MIFTQYNKSYLVSLPLEQFSYIQEYTQSNKGLVPRELPSCVAIFQGSLVFKEAAWLWPKYEKRCEEGFLKYLPSQCYTLHPTHASNVLVAVPAMQKEKKQ